MQNTMQTAADGTAKVECAPVLDLVRLRAQKAVQAIQDASVRSGLSKMTLEEINAEIDAARAERRAGAKNS